jgi:membrane fusion protein (multidrug efflux system)
MPPYSKIRCPARFALLAVNLALAACSGAGGSQGAGDEPATEVTVVTLKSEPVTLTRELAGRTRAYLVAEVRPQVSGIVKRRLFTEGGTVKAGQALYELDAAMYRAEHERAQAALRKAEATLLAAQLTATRSRDLIRINAVSLQDNEKAIAAEAQAQADVAAAKAEMDSSGVTLAYARIVAPISGRIGKSNVTQGALVTADQEQALATIQQLDPIYVEVSQSSSDWLALQQEIEAGRVQTDAAGATARILLENGGAYPETGKVQFTDVTVDSSTGSLLLRVIVPNPKLLLLPGMYVRAVLNEGALSQAMLVPQRGITRDPNGNGSALVVGRDSKVESRTVRVSRAIGEHWLVEEGLLAGDRVIIEGSQKVEQGTLVRPLEQAAAIPRPGEAAASGIPATASAP